MIVLMWWYRLGMKWLGLGAGRRELKELEKTAFLLVLVDSFTHHIIFTVL